MIFHRDPGRPVTRHLSEDGSLLTVHIPMTLQKQGGRKLIVLPETASLPVPAPRRDDTLLKALARAHRWRRMIETGRSQSITDLAEQEKVTASYVNRLVALTVLAPDIASAILDGRQPKGLKLAEILRDMPLDWQAQRTRFGFASPAFSSSHA